MKVKTLNDIPSIAKYLARIGAEPRSLRTAVVRENHGAYWRDVAVIKFGDTIRAPDPYKPTEQEASLIKAESDAADWPKIKTLGKTYSLPDKLKGIDPETIFEFRNEKGDLVMLQQRIKLPGDKAYVPWTFWDDNEWRSMEPEGKLPLWGIEQLAGNSTVFIHEGAKAARAIARLINPNTDEEKEALASHPWGEELSAAAHVGWIGGALSPQRTDWSPLRRAGIKRAYIVSDNDDPGLDAVPKIAYQLNIPTFHLQFTNEWPASFDLADDFPKTMFKKLGKSVHYVGPSFRSCIHPATWATDQIPQAKGKPITILREEFKSLWAYVEQADAFVCKEMPEILRDEKTLNKMLASFSHSSNTAGLIVKAYRGRTVKLCYRPDNKGRTVTDRTTSAINLHTPTHIKVVKGDPKPWLDFLSYMFPDETERKGVERWCATLIAKPEVRMEYGMLLVSEAQGIGKTTLGATVLAPLVGDQNVGFPSEDDITNSPFNSWVCNKRLIIIGEIYSGHSWKAYNKLKGYITDRDIQFNEKYMRPYRVENWVHIVACSNSRKALKMETSDRRWFYPTVTEKAWPMAKFGAFNEWLGSGGLQIIRHWAQNYGSYVKVGERAPMTAAKVEMIKGSRSEQQQELADLCEAINQDNVAVALAMKDVTAWLRAKLGNRLFDSDHDLRKAAFGEGFTVFNKRIKVGSQMQYILISPALAKDIEGKDEEAAMKKVRLAIKHPGELTQETM